jgi:hypothetical protein
MSCDVHAGTHTVLVQRERESADLADLKIPYYTIGVRMLCAMY